MEQRNRLTIIAPQGFDQRLAIAHNLRKRIELDRGENLGRGFVETPQNGKIIDGKPVVRLEYPGLISIARRYRVSASAQFQSKWERIIAKEVHASAQPGSRSSALRAAAFALGTLSDGPAIP